MKLFERSYRLADLKPGGSGLYTNHKHIDLDRELIDANVRLWDTDDVYTFPVLVTRNQQGHIVVWCETPRHTPPPFLGEGVPAVFHKLDTITITDEALTGEMA